MKQEIPIWEKAYLTLEEAATDIGIGSNTLRDLTNEKKYNFVLFVGTKRLIKRKLFEKFLESTYVI